MNQASQASIATSRRQFLRHSAQLATVAAALPLARGVHAAGGGEEIKIALIGCGGRGTGAAAQALSTAGPVKLWAMADAFSDRLTASLKNLQKGNGSKDSASGFASLASKIDVPPERQFVGLDAYQKAIDSGIDLVVTATPPGFRPWVFEYAVQAGKHIFMEKPLATDAPGVRRMLAANEIAKAKGLKVGVGCQRRHQPHCVETIDRIHNGALGKVICLRCYWVGGPPPTKMAPLPGLTELESQIRNWYHFTWLSGDHIVEQHIHNIDVCNWVAGAYPVLAQGSGGRQVRTGKGSGEIFDHHTVEFTYADGMKMFSFSRQIPGCWNKVGENAHGPEGTADIYRGEIESQGKVVWQPASKTKSKGRSRKAAAGPNPYQLEHDALFDAIRNNKPYNEADYGTKSTMTAIMGRMATYSGKEVTWDEAFASNLDLGPKELNKDAKTSAVPRSDGTYPVAMPGITKAW